MLYGQGINESILFQTKIGSGSRITGEAVIVLDAATYTHPSFWGQCLTCNYFQFTASANPVHRTSSVSFYLSLHCYGWFLHMFLVNYCSPLCKRCSSCIFWDQEIACFSCLVGETSGPFSWQGYRFLSLPNCSSGKHHPVGLLTSNQRVKKVSMVNGVATH